MSTSLKTVASAERVSVLSVVVRCERRLVRRDVGWWTAAVVLAACAAYAFADGRARLDARARVVAEARRDEDRRLARLTEQLDRIERGEAEPPGEPYLDPRNPMFMGRSGAATTAHLPDAPLAVAAAGLSDVHPPVFHVNAGSKDGFLFADEIANPAHRATGGFDLAFVVVYLFPLLLLALSYNVLSGEREQGTLALTVASSAPLSTVLAGKLAVRAGAAAVVLIAACWGLAAVTGPVHLGLEGVSALALLSLAVVVYGLFWAAIALLVNSLKRDSAFNAVALVSVWVVLLLAAPAALNATAQILYPAPPRSEMVLAVRDAAVGLERDRKTADPRYRAEHGGEGAIDDPRSRELLAVTIAADARADAVLEEQEARVQTQRRLTDRLSYLVPPTLMNDVVVELAGNGHARWDDYLERIDGFHDRWQAFFVDRARNGRILTTADYAALPRFDSAGGGGGWIRGSLPRVLASIAWIGALAVAMLAWSSLRLSKVA